ncbi:TPA: hypothetical protein ACGXQC_000849 [Bacillus cereus]
MNIPKQLMIGSVPYDVEVVKGFLERDAFGNFYVANDEYSVILDGE